MPEKEKQSNATITPESTKERRKSLPRTWTPETMALAIEAVNEKRLTIRKASEIFKIPKSTLCDRISGKCQKGMRAIETNRKWQFNEERLRTICKANSDEKCNEVFSLLKEGAIGIKDAAKVIGISGWKLYKYLKNEMEVPDSGEKGDEDQIPSMTFDPDCVKSRQIVSNQDKIINNSNTNQVENENEMEESEEEEEIEDYDSDEVEEIVDDRNLEQEMPFGGQLPHGNGMNKNIQNMNQTNQSDLTEDTVSFATSSLTNELDNTMNSSTEQGSSSVRKKRKCKQWTEETMREAVKAVKENKLPVRRVAHQFGIPKSSLQDRVSGKVDRVGKSPGRSPKPRIFKKGAIERLSNKQPDREKDWVFKALTEGSISIKEAARQYGVSYYTLKDCIKGPNDKIDDPNEVDLTPEDGEKKKRIRHKWSVFDMKRALASVKEEHLSIRFAASKFGIPKSTLADVVSGKCEIGKSPGPKKFLSDDEEQCLAGWLVTMHKIGKEVSRQEVLDTVKTMLDKDGRQLPKVDDNKPKEGWWYGFLRRHKEVAEIRKTKKEKTGEASEEEKKSKEEKKKERDAKQQEKESKKLERKRKALEKKVQKLAEQIIIEQGRQSTENFARNLFESKKQRLEDSVSEGEGFCVACGGSYSADSNEVWICCGAVDAEGNLVDGCGGWFHVRCTDLSECNLTTEELQIITWHCQACTAVACIQNDIDM